MAYVWCVERVVAPGMREVATLPLMVWWVAMPVATVVVHFRLHQPRETRVLLSFVTAALSVVLAITVGITRWAAEGPK